MAAKKAASKPETVKGGVVIPHPNILTMLVKIKGTAPYVQHKFSKKVLDDMLQSQMAGSTSRGKKKRQGRDIQSDFKEAQHLDPKGNHGIPAPAFRSAMISACRLCGFQMTKAKLSVFVEPDTFDVDDGTPLVLIKGKPEMHQTAVRLETGVASIAVRPMWRKWDADVLVRFDADQFTKDDVVNLMARAGLQVGIGEGRPDSKKSHGMGWGTFEVVGGV